MSFIRLVVVVTCAAMLAACADMQAHAQRASARQAAYVAAAGAPVNSFRMFNPLWSWEPLSDTQVAIYTRPNQAFLLDLDGACQNLEFATAIGLTSNLHQVSVRFDKVLTGRRYPPCTIMQIRPIDVARLKVEQQAQRKIDEAARPPSG